MLLSKLAHKGQEPPLRLAGDVGVGTGVARAPLAASTEVRPRRPARRTTPSPIDTLLLIAMVALLQWSGWWVEE